MEPVPGSGTPAPFLNFLRKHTVMKSIKLALPLMLTFGLALSSCIREDLSECFSDNLLEMSYKGDGTEEIFPDKICRVDMYVFDSEGNCVSSAMLPQEQVDSRVAQLPPLDPGTYHIVCLGNPHSTVVDRISSGDYGQIVFMDEDYMNGEVVSGNDSLYFAAIDYEVVSGEDQRRIVEFESSHYDLSVEVAGVPDPNSKAAGAPSIMVCGVSPQTTFENVACGEPENYVLEATHDVSRQYLSATANIMRHTDHSAVDVCVVAASGETLAEINLADFLADNPEVDCTRQEVLIPIYIEFKSGEVLVRLPEWYVQEVKPEF